MEKKRELTVHTSKVVLRVGKMITGNQIDEIKHRLDKLKIDKKIGIHEKIKKYTEISKNKDYQSYKKARDDDDYFLTRDILERQSDEDKEYFDRCYKFEKYFEEMNLVLKKGTTKNPL